MKLDLRKIDLNTLKEWLISKEEKPFRAKQIQEWLWKKSAQSIDEMTNLSLSLREQLKEEFELNSITADKIQYSDDGTIKSRFKLHDGHLIESVLIPVVKDRRFTVCVSTQVGCSLTCSFCATGKMKRARNLSAGEIYDQVIEVQKQCIEKFDHPLTNIVYMGMGEPLLNYAEVLKSVDHITNPNGLNWSPKRITVSTAGVAKMIRKLADDQVKFNLAISLHAPTDEQRNEIMPINETNNLEVLMEALQYFYQKTKNKISYEYIAFQHFNESPEDAHRLAKLCQDFPVKINIIEYNSVDGVTLLKSDPERTDRFAAILNRLGIRTTIRRSRGKDIDAACGQLANKE